MQFDKDSRGVYVPAQLTEEEVAIMIESLVDSPVTVEVPNIKAEYRMWKEKRKAERPAPYQPRSAKKLFQQD